jgi:hypothetical protein
MWRLIFRFAQLEVASLESAAKNQPVFATEAKPAA